MTTTMRKTEEHTARVYEATIEGRDIYIKVMDNGKNKTIYTYISTEERYDLLYWAKTTYCKSNKEETELLNRILEEVSTDIEEILNAADRAYWSQDVDNLVYRSLLGL